jgi:hypothetical protein
MTKFGWLEEKSCKRSPSNNWLDLDKKSINLHWKRHEKTNPSFNSPSLFPLSNPFFAQTIAIAIVIAIHLDDRQRRMGLALSPPQQPAMEAAAAAIFHNPANI